MSLPVTMITSPIPCAASIINHRSFVCILNTRPSTEISLKHHFHLEVVETNRWIGLYIVLKISDHIAHDNKADIVIVIEMTDEQYF